MRNLLLKSAYVCGLYLMGSPMCKTMGLSSGMGPGPYWRTGLRLKLARRPRLGLLKTPLADGKLEEVGEPDRGVIESMGVLAGIGVLVGSAIAMARRDGN
jgi:hypothetical protein